MVEAVDIIREIVDLLDLVSPGNIFLNPLYVAPWYTKPDKYTAFVANLLTSHLNPMFVFSTAITGTPPRGLVEEEEFIATGIGAKITEAALTGIKENVLQGLSSFGESPSSSPELHVKEETWIAFITLANEKLLKPPSPESMELLISEVLKVALRVKFIVHLMKSYFSGFSPSLDPQVKSDNLIKILAFINDIFETGPIADFKALFTNEALISKLSTMNAETFYNNTLKFSEKLIKTAEKTFEKAKNSKKLSDAYRSAFEGKYKSSLSDFKDKLKRAIDLVLQSSKYHKEIESGAVASDEETLGLLNSKDPSQVRRSPLTYSHQQYFKFLDRSKEYLLIAWPSSPSDAEAYATPVDIKTHNEEYKSETDPEFSTKLPAPLRRLGVIGSKIDSTSLFTYSSHIGQVIGAQNVGDDDEGRGFSSSQFSLPSGGSIQADDIANGQIDPNIHTSLAGNFSKMFDRIRESSPNILLRVIAQTYMGTLATKDAILAGIHHNVAHMFNYIIARPHITVATEATISVVAGAAGRNYYMPPTFELGDDMKQRMHYGNMLFYHKTVITEPKAVVIIDDSIVTDYIGGRGMRFIDKNTYNPSEDTFGRDSTSERNSIFALMVPRNFVNMNEIINLSGFSGSDEMSDEPEQPHYPSWRFYSAYWNWAHMQSEHDSFEFGKGGNFANLLCHTGPSLSWNHISNSFDILTRGNGHWNADYTYPGSKDAMLANGKSFDENPWRGVQVSVR